MFSTQSASKAVDAGEVAAPTASFPQPGEVILGLTTGRQSEEKIALFHPTETGIQNTAIAILACQKSPRHKAGTTFRT